MTCLVSVLTWGVCLAADCSVLPAGSNCNLLGASQAFAPNMCAKGSAPHLSGAFLIDLHACQTLTYFAEGQPCKSRESLTEEVIHA